QRPGAGAGQVVQPLTRIRFPDLRRGDAGYLRAYGNIAPVRDDRVAPRPVRAGAVRTRFQGDDGCRNPAGKRLARTVVALVARPFDPYLTQMSARRPKMAPVSVAGSLVFDTIAGLGSRSRLFRKSGHR